MSLDYENLTTQQKQELIFNGHHFLRALGDAGGAELAHEIWNQLASLVSPVYCQQMLMHLLTGHVGYVVITDIGASKIEAIKVVRKYTLLSLWESNDVVNEVQCGRSSQVLPHDPRQRQTMISELRAIGCRCSD